MFKLTFAFSTQFGESQRTLLKILDRKDPTRNCDKHLCICFFLSEQIFSPGSARKRRQNIVFSCKSFYLESLAHPISSHMNRETLDNSFIFYHRVHRYIKEGIELKQVKASHTRIAQLRKGFRKIIFTPSVSGDTYSFDLPRYKQPRKI